MKTTKLVALSVCILSVFLLLNLNNAYGLPIDDFDYTFEQDEVDGSGLFDRTSNLRFVQDYDEGNYDAEFGFDDQVGYEGVDIEFVDVDASGAGCIVNVSADFLGHTGVLCLNDNGNPGKASIVNEFTSQNNITYEFWWATDSITPYDYLIVDLREGTTIIVSVLFHQATINLLHPTGPAWVKGYDGYVVDTWYHIAIECDDTNNVSSLFVNGIECLSSIPTYNNVSVGSDNVHMYTNGGNSGFIHYIDAFDYSFNIGYQAHRNLGCVHIDTEIYETDKYCFHQNDVNTRLSTFNDNELGWEQDDESSGFGTWSLGGGMFENPETGVIDGNNDYIQINVAGDGAEVSLSHNFTESDGIIKITLEAFIFSMGTLAWIGARALDEFGTNMANFQIVNLAGTQSVWVGAGGVSDYNENKGNIVLGVNTISIEWEISYGVQCLRINNSDDTDVYLHNSTVGVFERLEIYAEGLGAGAQTIFMVDNIGVYLNETSMNENEYGYGSKEDIDYTAFSGYILYYDGYFGLGTTTPSGVYYICETDDLDELKSMGNESGTMYLSDLNESLTFSVHPNGTMELGGIYGDIEMVENGNIEYVGQVQYGMIEYPEAMYSAIDDTLRGYTESNGSDQWMYIAFDIDDRITTNFTLSIFDVYRTNWHFGVDITLNFTDYTEYTFSLDINDGPFQITDIMETNFGWDLPSHKYIDAISINMTSGLSANGTTNLGGVDSIYLRYEGEFIDLVDLEDTSILGAITGVLMLIIPSFLIIYGIEVKRKGAGKKLAIPIIAIVSVILFVTGVLPTWLFFVSLLGLGGIMLMRRWQQNR